jgi:hypothetical protein
MPLGSAVAAMLALTMPTHCNDHTDSFVLPAETHWLACWFALEHIILPF